MQKIRVKSKKRIILIVFMVILSFILFSVYLAYWMMGSINPTGQMGTGFPLIDQTGRYITSILTTLWQIISGIINQIWGIIGSS